MTTRRVFMKQMLAGGLAAGFPMLSFANDWPKRPVKLIVPFAPGGNTDGIARLIGQHLGKKFGETFVVENRLGAGGMIATEALARAAPDGYTMMVVSLSQLAILPAIQTVSYDPVKDIAPVCNLASNPFCMVANPTFEPKTLKDFIVYVKARPGKLTYASGGTGSLSHLTMVLFLQRAGLDMAHVPYKGGAPAITDVIGNQVPVYFGNLSEALPHAGGALNLLAISGSKRSKKLPGVPTIAESGYPGFRSETWNGIIAPAKTPQAIIDLVAVEAKKAVADPEILKRFDSYGVDPLGSTPKEFADIISADIAQWGSAIKAAGVKL